MSQLRIERVLADQRFIYEAIRGCRLSKGSIHKMDSSFYEVYGMPNEWGLRTEVRLDIGPNDRRFLLDRLNGPNDAERKFLRAIPVSVFITGPLRWWVDADTYKIATVKQSSSLMHHFKSRGELKPEDFTPTTPLESIEVANHAYREWVASGGKATSANPLWEKFQDAIPRGYLYTAQWEANYAVVRTVLGQRWDHRQREFRQLCEELLQQLPHSWLITHTKGDNNASA